MELMNDLVYTVVAEQNAFLQDLLSDKNSDMRSGTYDDMKSDVLMI